MEPSSFALHTELGRLTKSQLEAAGELYQRTARQVRRWHTLGKQAAEPCPLDRPAQMPDWWERMRTLGKIAWSCPPSVLAAAQKAKTSDGETPRSTTQEPPTVEVGGVDLERFELQEANEIRELQLLRAAKWDAIVRAHKHGTPSDALQNEHRRLIDQIDKMKSRAEARLKARGVLVNVESVQADVALACELIRQMSESEARSLEERIPNLAPEQITALRQAVASISAARARILRNLRTLRSIPEALTELAVAGC